MKISRRKFLLSTAVVGGGVLIAYSATRPSRHKLANADLAEGEERYITSYLKVMPNNEVTSYFRSNPLNLNLISSKSGFSARYNDGVKI